MIHELAVLGDPRLQDFRIGEPSSDQVTQTQFADMLRAGFKKLPTLYTGEMHRRFDYASDLFGFSWKRMLFGSNNKHVVEPVELGPVAHVRQVTDSDCVGAMFLSVLSAITGTKVSKELYEAFLKVSLEERLAQKESGGGIRVEPFVFNVLMTPALSQKPITVAYSRDLNLSDMSLAAQEIQKKGGELYILPVLVSDTPRKRPNSPIGAHHVALQRIQPEGVTIYDPKNGEQRELTHEIFAERWKYDDNNAIFVFAEK